MEKIKIGYSAGKIWQEIEKNGLIKIADLKKNTKMDIKDIYMALGWLAREDKVSFSEIGGELAVNIIN